MMDLVFFMLIIVYLCLFVGMIFIKSETSMKKEGREEGKKMKEGGEGGCWIEWRDRETVTDHQGTPQFAKQH